jgi:hypothetical protein
VSLAAPPRRQLRRTWHQDAFYGRVALPGWARALLATNPFRRLQAISLSDVPGDLLFGRPFPSRLDHALGVYALVRAARPRDRVLQVAALAHDLGHGPFSHLTEPLLIEQRGEDHEQRSARFLRELSIPMKGPRAADGPQPLTPSAARQLAWLDWDEAARLIVASGADGRGELLHGQLDYDNIDNVARFLVASGLGSPSYDPIALARGLRLLPTPPFAHLPFAVGDGRPDRRCAVAALEPPAGVGRRAFLLAAVAVEARGWQRDRTTVYTYLHEQHTNLALHATLRKAIDLALLADALPGNFLDFTDTQALRLLCHLEIPGITALLRAVHPARRYRCLWEVELPLNGHQSLMHRFGRWRDRLGLEERLAVEAALAPHEVIVEAIASSASRPLPPFAPNARGNELILLPASPLAPARVHVFAPAGIPGDYARRVCMAAERLIGGMGTVVRSAVE